ncbi:MAG: hypothetical protein ACI828_002539 [Flavobacteriales bacterium]|jgi:hypothetical protein
MTLLQPSYLWGLLALAIPIAIHLWSLKKVRTIKVGSTQFIAETKSKQSNSIQLNEWWLLAIRCLIISTLVFILAKPHSSKKQRQQDIVYVFEPSLLATEDGRARFIQIPEEGRRLLRSGFPDWQVDTYMNVSDEVPNYWQLAQQMVQIPADSIVVFTRAFAKAVKGKRPEVAAHINWIPVDVESTISEPLVAIAKKDSIALLTVQRSATSLAFAKIKTSNNSVSFNTTKDSIEIKTERGLRTVPVQNQKPLQVTLIYDKAENAQRVYFEAAFRAIAKYTDRDIQLNTIENSESVALEESDYLVVLGNRSVADLEIPTLIYRSDAFAKDLIVPGNTAIVSFLTKKLTPQIVVEEHLVEQMLQWLQLDREIEDQLDALDIRTVSVNQLQTTSPADTGSAKKRIVADMSDRLWILLLLLLVGERLLARIRKQ